jgi:uncharacterized membrane protein
MTWFIIGFGLLRFLGLVFAVLLVVKIALVIGKKMQGKHEEMHKKTGTSDAIKLAAQRFADGDISADQYREIKLVLETG